MDGSKKWVLPFRWVRAIAMAMAMVIGSACVSVWAAEDPKAKLAEIEDRLNKLRSPFRSAEKFWVEEIIDPRKTRSLLCDFARLAAPVLTPGKVSFKIRP